MPDEETAVKPAPDATQESPPPASEGAEGTFGGNGAAPDPEKLQQDWREAVGSVDDETVKLFYDALDPERRERLWGQEVERRAQSRADSQDSQARLELAKTKIEDEAALALRGLRDRFKESENAGDITSAFEEHGRVIASTSDRLWRAELDHGLRTHAVYGALTDEDKRKFASVERQDDPAAARLRVRTMLDRAVEYGRGQAPAVAKEAAEAQAKGIDILSKLLAATKGSAEQVSSGQITPQSAMTDDERLLDPKTPIDEVIAIRARQKRGG